MEPLPTKDKLIIAMLGFFMLVALTLEWWWLRHSTADLLALRDTSLFARLFDLYGSCDRAYFESRTPLATALEAVNVYFTQLLNLALIWAIVKRAPWRHPLQLALGAYLSYSVVLYYLVAHVSGYPTMRHRATDTYVLFYGVNAPWLLAHLYLVWDSTRAICERFVSVSAAAYRALPSDSPGGGNAWAEVNDAGPAA